MKAKEEITTAGGVIDIDDNDIRVLGKVTPPSHHRPVRRRWWLWVLAAVIVTLAACCIIALSLPRRGSAPSKFSPQPACDTAGNVIFDIPQKKEAYTDIARDTVNDIALKTYTPVGGHVEMHVGRLEDAGGDIILAALAADYRADNGKIAGAFVYRGEVLSRGHPKYGFCAIIGDQLTMGMGRETSLFERAVEQEGYFFRQFSLVHDGKPGETLPKGKAVRRALCYRSQSITVIETVGRESMHDFTQALIDMGVQEAIGLVGSQQIPICTDRSGNTFVGEMEHQANAQEAYLVWRR